MSPEWQLFVFFILGTALLVWRQSTKPPLWVSLVIPGLVGVAIFGARWWENRIDRHQTSLKDLRQIAPGVTSAGGYVGSARCQSCHPQEYDTWHDSFHRTMTQAATGDAVLGDFDDRELTIDGHEIQLERRGDEYWVEMVDPDWIHDFAKREQAYAQGQSPAPPQAPATPPRTWKRVSMTTGSHHYQVLWVPSEKIPNVQFALPFAWLIADQRWAPRTDVFIMDPNRKSPVQVWNLTCIQCHSTGGRPQKSNRTNLFNTEVGEYGIACEACHGPGEQHVKANKDTLRRYQYHLNQEADPTIVNPARLAHDRATEVCGQCHGVRWQLDRENWMAHGFRYRPGKRLEDSTPILRRNKLSQASWAPPGMENDHAFLDSLFWPDGMIRVAGREMNGLLETACFQSGQMSCLSCHSMHQSKPNDQLAQGMESNQSCLQCHETFRDNLEQHTRHGASSSGSLCYNCHMPHATYGLLKAIRNHQIDSPHVATTVESGRPNACNLCHLDKTLEWTSSYLQEWYDHSSPPLDADEKSVSHLILHVLKGDAAQRALAAWALGWEPAQEVSGTDWMAPFLAELLTDPYPAIRYIAHQSLKSLPEYADVAFDFSGSNEERRSTRQSVTEIWEAESERKRLPSEAAPLLLNQDASLNRNRLTRLILQRDHRPVFLVE